MVYEVVTQHVAPENRDEHVKTWRKAWQEAAFEGAHGSVLKRVLPPAQRNWPR